MLLLLVVVFAFTVALPATAAAAFAIITRDERAMRKKAAELKLREAEIVLAYKELELDEHRYRTAIGTGKDE